MSETQTQKTQSNLEWKKGGCLCGAVRFEAQVDLTAPVGRCNCTICTKVGSTGTVVKPSAFRLVSGEEHLGRWSKGGSPNYRVFCKQCGTQVFGEGNVPELGGEFRSVNVNCLDDVDLTELNIGYWDGRHDNWQAGMRPQPWPVRARA
ncbi:GFA family protein [Pyxidicoccus parkwayensis]|uniref:GFA family protein n=1 Tax=Pyxidicoccus parkwayensis TaxID=2813578 RepID=A0ABX7NPZ3_9BACT|nr:GFA family protein [Pyxidicoccus parkwaysis]QSQ19519.1 GFA family protein [Pyxidicoccus parkwaysis]